MVAPSLGAWIEIRLARGDIFTAVVAPSLGAWIEIFGTRYRFAADTVAPSLGAWIEIGDSQGAFRQRMKVAPSLGAWIEISVKVKPCNGGASLPRWERGLK